MFILSRAVDGNLADDYFQNSCTHTVHEEDSPWLVIDLSDNYAITHVKIQNRGDCCGE